MKLLLGVGKHMHVQVACRNLVSIAAKRLAGMYHAAAQRPESDSEVELES